MTVFSVLYCVIGGVERPVKSTPFLQVPVPKVFILLSISRLQSGENQQKDSLQSLCLKAAFPNHSSPVRK